MKITHLRIENYKGLREIDLPLSQFACLIGENNAGKSSILQALSLFFTGTTLPKTHWFEDGKPIRIEIAFSEITDADINRLADEHRTKIKPIVKAGALRLVRVYGVDGKSVLKYRTLLPNEERFLDTKINDLVKGKKPGQSFADAVKAIFPELKDVVTASMNIGVMKEKIQALADSIPDNQKSISDADLPSGIDKSISAMLPDPIYIPAVKDFRDDVKTSEGTPFGKILGILLEAIEPELGKEKTFFEELNRKLNRCIQSDGKEKDERLAPVKTIEETVERFVQDSFRAVKLRITIPPPQLKTVLSSALIYANDGVDGPVDSKGDGLRRAIVFAILRSYVELSKTGLISDRTGQAPGGPGHILLFEEPELYLHPNAQKVLFDALGAFSDKHPVIVTTHSPAFFGPQSTTTFIKMRKKTDVAVAPKPFGEAYLVELGSTTAKDQFQIICYENNNIAFFADTVVLIEGDSDYIVIPHLARTINPSWDVGQLPIRFARIGGKSNIYRYKEFFGRFQTRVLLVTDLDFLLGGEFGQINPSDEIKTQRDQLLAALDADIGSSNPVADPSAERLKEAQERGSLRALWKNARELQAKQKAGQASLENVFTAVDEFFAWEKYWPRRDRLRDCSGDLLNKKRSLLKNLRGHGVCVLERGAIEDYYPAGIVGKSKPEKAQSFCNSIKTREQALALCANGQVQPGKPELSEFEAIFQTIFMPT